LFLNKATGQKVVVPARFKHAHSLTVATSEHISVHCCVNAAGNALPPMLIFTKSLTGGTYHRQGPINASCACSGSGFMDHQYTLKTTHITQPLDVAVYRKMKIETARVISQAKMVKSDLWVSKKQVSAIFKIIFEKSMTMDCISEGFRKCGIYHFNPNAVDKPLLLRSCTDVDPEAIDLSIPTFRLFQDLRTIYSTTQTYHCRLLIRLWT